MDKKHRSISRRKALGLAASAGTAAVLSPSALSQIATLKTPGVYVEERDAFPNSVYEVATSIPVFIGYTEKATHAETSLHMKAARVGSLSEYSAMFGEGAARTFDLLDAPTATGRSEKVSLDAGDGMSDYYLTETSTRYALYDAVRMFYADGGEQCYVISVGGYSEAVEVEALLAGLALVDEAKDAALLLVPDAARLAADDAATIDKAMLKSCGTSQSRFAILDVANGDKPRIASEDDPIEVFRAGIGADYLSYGAAYYPWIETSLYVGRDIKLHTFTPQARMILSNALRQDLAAADSGELSQDQIALIGAVAGPQRDPKAPPMPHPAGEREVAPEFEPAALNNSLQELSDSFQEITNRAAMLLNLQPPSGAMAGVYARVDNSAGVWRAPANTGIVSANQPVIAIDNDAQADLNTPIDGKAVNAIRSFQGRGVLIWGARTLDGNSLDWRYISVRRTMIMIEQSVKAATRAYVFEPNTGTTWTTIRSMISNYLTNIWKQGGLAGATPSDAFSVEVGLGSTMTAQDILDSKMRIEVKVAVSRPAEFIVFAFEQQMQQS